MKTKKITPVLLIGIVLILFAGGFSWLGNQPAANLQQVTTDTRRITVNGVGEVSTPADIATVNLGVRTIAETAQEALDENSEQVQSVLQTLRDEGVASSDIETSSIQLFPQYDRTGETQDVTGFEASNIVTATIRDIDALGEILDAAVEAGSNTIQNIQFQASETEELVDQARELAVENAQTKAEQLADLFGVQLGPVMTIDETSTSPVTPAARQVEFAADAAVPVEPGSQMIRVQVLVTWQIVSSEESVGINPDQIYPIVQIQPVSGPAGTEVTLMAEGFPANTVVDLGVGRWRSEYDVVRRATTSEDGNLETEVTIPSSAEVTEQWVVVVTTLTGTMLTETSNVFLVTNP